MNFLILNIINKKIIKKIIIYKNLTKDDIIFLNIITYLTII